MKRLFFIGAIALSTLAGLASCSKDDPTKGNVTYENAMEYLDKQESAIRTKKQTCEFDKYAVDLGLSVYWSSVNLGAENIGEIGDYFFWGHTTANPLSDDNKKALWKFWDSANGCLNDDFRAIDMLEGENDAAATIIGNGWRLPTIDEIRELIYSSNYRRDSYNGQVGGLVWTAAGVLFFAGERGDSKQNSYIWSSSKSDNDLFPCMEGYFHTNSGSGNTYGYTLKNIRPVKDKEK